MKSSILIVAISLFLIHFKGFSQKNETQRLTAVNLTVRDSSDNSVLKDIVIKADFQRASLG